MTLSADRLKVTLNPTSDLTAGTTYTATLRANDDARLAMPAPLTWSVTSPG
ncbi:MAG: Ig-like domain-containing protein [Geodermatophilaceae bacterium]|nr:Ig-like domain-containing protein [Geodermatophilaceae bacterium]